MATRKTTKKTSRISVPRGSVFHAPPGKVTPRIARDIAPKKARTVKRGKVAMPADLDAFSKLVQAAANTTPSNGRFGERNAFVSHVERRLGAMGFVIPADFRHRLIQAKRARRIGLARADLVAAMNQKDVDESETVDADRFGRFEYHFIRINTGR